MRRSVRPLALALLGSACAAEPALGAPAPDALEQTGSSGSIAAGSESASSTSDVQLGPPEVIDIGKDASTLSEGGAIVVTATVRDPDGDDDIVDGRLVLAETDIEVAPFARGSGGRYTAPLSWADLVRLDPPDFVATAPLRIVGRFTDASGMTAEGETTVLLVCVALSGASCDGTCVDLESNDDHCGECGHACEVAPAPFGGPPWGGCESGRCGPTLAACALAERLPDCTAACAEEGRTCASDCSGGFVAFLDTRCTVGAHQPGSAGCDPDPFGWPIGGSVRCCCEAP
jgi:hypothetical protein